MPGGDESKGMEYNTSMITAVILTKNEEKNIEQCLRTLTWCDEILVIDDNSTDKTVILVEKHDVTVFEHALNNNFSSQRNFGIEKARGEWIFFVDADEEVPEPLRLEILGIIHNTKDTNDAYTMQRVDVMWGTKLLYGEVGNKRLLRLAKKGTGKWVGDVHESWKIVGNIGALNNSLLHHPHQSVADFLREINFYTSLRAGELHRKGMKVNWWSIIVYPSGKFFSNFFLKLGFLDGVSGLLVALFMSMHSFLVRAKLWALTTA